MKTGKQAPATTRDRILHQGLELLSEAGLAGVTLGVLAERVHMSKSGLFAHFRSKDEVQVSLLDHAAAVSQARVVRPAMDAPEGRPRLEALVANWLGWTERAGLPGGCPIAAAMFELDDVEGEVRDHVLALEREWRQLLRLLVQQAVDHGHFRAGLDVEQFVWELCNIYLGHHVSRRFVRDPRADQRAHTALRALMGAAAAVKHKKKEPLR